MRWLLAALVLAATPASAQNLCATLDKIADVLREDHREVPVQIGDTRAGQVVVFATPDGGTWTIVVVSPDGRACVVSDGKRWRATGRGA